MFKKVMVVLIGVFLSASSFASTAKLVEANVNTAAGLVSPRATIEGRAVWVSNKQFSTLMQGGVMLSAVDRAMSRCYQDGYSDCGAASWYIVSCNNISPDPSDNGQYICEGTAIVRGM